MKQNKYNDRRLFFENKVRMTKNVSFIDTEIKWMETRVIVMIGLFTALE